MRHGSEACVKKSRALLAQAGAQGGDQSDELDAGLPGKKLADVLFDDGFGARDFPFAGLPILLHDAA